MIKIPLSLLLLVSALEALPQNKESYVQSIPGTPVSFKMIAVPSGRFTMGSPSAEKGRDDDEGPEHEVELSAFWIAEHEVTFAEWDAFFKNMQVPQTKNVAVDAISRPTTQYIDLTWGMGRDGRHPTNSMSHQAAIMYCKWLTENTGVFYRLPTEAEWEYACRAGGQRVSNLGSSGYFLENSQGKFQKTASLKPNAWGLYDMLGNLSEWTLDQYDPAAYTKLKGVQNPVMPPASKYPKVVRGGSYLDEQRELRCANRIASDASWNKRDPQIPKSKWWLTDGMFVGFRIVRPAQQPSKEEIEKFYSTYLK
jgi:formylglycine-generating enzyme required for sulfatase activity